MSPLHLPFRATGPDATGTLRTTAGKAVVIWRKDPDGLWRAVVDIWNANPVTLA